MHKFPAGYFARVVCSGADGQEALGWQSPVGPCVGVSPPATRGGGSWGEVGICKSSSWHAWREGRLR